jgi:flagellar basal body-associated protein FliL
MSAMPSPIQDFPAGLPIRGQMDSTHGDLEDDPFASEQMQERQTKRGGSSIIGLLIMFCIGVAVTVAWYSFGGPVRDAIAGVSPQLAWIAPQPAAVAPSAADAAAAPAAAPAVDVSAALPDLDAVRQNVDRIAAAQDKIIRSIDQLSTGQEQLTKEITKLQAVEQYILYKNSEPPAARTAPAPAAIRKPAAPLPLTPPVAQQTQPAAPAH